tara:strand:- start:1153 stop:1920 length:768 start_codon:yes stop_codon:yes gene_type:complete
MIKSLIKSFLKILGFKIYKVSDDNVLLRQSQFLNLKLSNKNKDLILYNKAEKLSGSEKNANFEKKIRFLNLIFLVRNILNTKSKIYHFVECGCWKGHSTYIISSLIKEYKKKINFHIFDSFEGLSSGINQDFSIQYNKKNQQYIEKYFVGDEIKLRKILKKFNFCKIHKGWIPSKFEKVKNKKFSFVHIDVDLYDPTMSSLEFFYPRLVKGGVICCDDYNYSLFPGATKAWNNFFKKKKVSFRYNSTISGSFIIK